MKYILINELNLKNPQIIYRLNNKILKSICTFSNYIQLYKGSQNIYINNIMEYKIMSEDMFNSIKTRKQSTLSDMTFFSPKDFDKNFYLNNSCISPLNLHIYIKKILIFMEF